MPQCFDRSVGRYIDVIERQHLILRNVPTQSAAFRETDRKGRGNPCCSSVLYEPVRTEPTNAIEPISGLKIAFGNRNHFANGAR